MNVLQSHMEVGVMVLLVAGVMGYVPLFATYGSTGVQKLFAVYLGLWGGILATAQTTVNLMTLSSAVTALTVVGTGMLFLVTAVTGHQRITQLVRRVQMQGPVVIDG